MRQIAPILFWIVLLVCTGTAHRWMGASRASYAMLFAPLAAPLSDLPIQLGPWVLTKELPLQREILQTAGVDRYLHREYLNRSNGKRVVLYVGYWGQENKGMGHGPEVCYPAAGWRPESRPAERIVQFERADIATRAALAFHRFNRSGPGGMERHLVGFTAVVDGQHQPSSRGVFWHRPGDPERSGGHFLAHVQVYTPVWTEAWDMAESDVLSFMELVLPKLASCFPQRPDGAQQSEDVKR